MPPTDECLRLLAMLSRITHPLAPWIDMDKLRINVYHLVSPALVVFR